MGLLVKNMTLRAVPRAKNLESQGGFPHQDGVSWGTQQGEQRTRREKGHWTQAQKKYWWNWEVEIGEERVKTYVLSKEVLGRGI